MQISPLTPLIGAEISGINLAQLDDAQFSEVHGAFLNHSVLFFRDQDLSIEEHMAFGRRFGELHVHPAANDYRAHGNLPPEILVIHADADTKRTAGDKWHSDVTCDAEPPMASILKLETVPENGGDTLFANMYAAYEALSAPMRNMLEQLTATHDGGPNYKDRAEKAGVDVGTKVYPRASHPVVRTHPETGRKALYVNEGFTTKIMELEHEESAALLQFLHRHATRPEFVYRHRWAVNDFVMWDNRQVMHRVRAFDDINEPRDMRRTTVREGTEPHTMDTGDDPYTELFSKSPTAVDINRARDAGR